MLTPPPASRPLPTACHSRFNYFSMSLRILELGKREGVIVNLCVCERTENSRTVCGESFSRERTERVSLGTISLTHVDEPQNSGKVTMIFSLFSSNSRPILSTIFSSKACKCGRHHSTYMTRVHAPQFLCTPIT